MVWSNQGIGSDTDTNLREEKRWGSRHQYLIKSKNRKEKKLILKSNVKIDAEDKR